MQNQENHVSNVILHIDIEKYIWLNICVSFYIRNEMVWDQVYIYNLIHLTKVIIEIHKVIKMN